MIHLEIPKKFRPLIEQAHMVSEHMFRPISRKYDRAEHEYPKELDMLASLMEGLTDSGSADVGAAKLTRKAEAGDGTTIRNGSNMATVLGLIEFCWGDVGLALTIPRQGLGNAAIGAVATPEQKERFKGRWVSMAITEPGAGSDSAAIRSTAHLDGDEWVLNGEKIYVTAGERSDAVVVWATLDRSLGRAAIKSFVVEKGTPGLEVARLEKKLGIRASDTATLLLRDCRIPKGNILGSPEVNVEKGFAGVMQTFDNTRPVVAAMAIGVARAALERVRELLPKSVVEEGWGPARWSRSAAGAELLRLEAELDASLLMTLKAAWMADNGRPNSMEASMAKAKAARVANEITLRCVELAASVGYAEDELLEKWSRDSKILDIFEGTQQIQLLVVARRLLGKSSADLR